jgi:hypothetical protein
MKTKVVKATAELLYGKPANLRAWNYVENKSTEGGWRM